MLATPNIAITEGNTSSIDGVQDVSNFADAFADAHPWAGESRTTADPWTRRTTIAVVSAERAGTAH